MDPLVIKHSMPIVILPAKCGHNVRFLHLAHQTLEKVVSFSAER